MPEPKNSTNTTNPADTDKGDDFNIDDLKNLDPNMFDPSKMNFDPNNVEEMKKKIEELSKKFEKMKKFMPKDPSQKEDKDQLEEQTGETNESIN